MPHTTTLPHTPTFSLTGKRALVSGASRGIGLAAAAALAQAGAHVTLLARTETEIKKLANDIQAEGGQAEALPLDLEDVPNLLSVIDQQAPFDILFNNAGTAIRAAFTDVRIEDYDKVMGLNVRSAFFVAQAVAKKLIGAKKGGSIINVSSQLGLVGDVDRAVYCASKHAIEGLTKAMALDLAQHNIRVNSLCPTYIETPLTKPILANPNVQERVLSRIKLGRVGQVEDLMGGIVYLASDASSLMTGTSLVIDGGWTAE